MPSVILHDEPRHRFTYERDGQVSYLQYHRLDEHTVDFASTYTPPALRGRGIAARVVEHAFRWAEESGYKVVPTCWFVAELVDRKPEWRRVLSS